MKPFYQFLILFLALLVNQGCNTLYNTKAIDIEIVVPGKVKIPGNYKTVAIKYNNSNISPNPFFQRSSFVDSTINRKTNLDSIASKVYFSQFIEEMKKQDFFDSITLLEEQDYSLIQVRDTNNYTFEENDGKILLQEDNRSKINVSLFSRLINQFPNTNKSYESEKYLDPHFGLYNASELQNIADSTNADLLLSLDYFASLDGIFYNKEIHLASEVVMVQACWNFYDLKKMEFINIYEKRDTILWDQFAENVRDVEEALPPRHDAVLNAADIVGESFAHMLIPHWEQVQRMYYSSGHIELKKTDQLIEEGKWLEAAEIWKANVNNPNKAIAAKSKYNMGLACEMQGNPEAALEWIVESFYVFGQKNQLHFDNCMDYIHILGQRKQDVKVLEKQFIDIE
ncbi:DUF6340 family protein [uncultured Draconibacterium sp.]|uniref:DUF6340 family protein n=1 Tax=uncultured Draconibacterium sp. TaxID=1573823 RepID=UPI0032167050